MRDLIFISHRISWPLNKGEKIRGWNLVTHLTRDYRVHFGCVVDDPADMAHVAKMQTICASVGAFRIDRQKQKLRALLRARPGRPLMPDFYHSPELQRWVDDTMARVRMDVVYIFSAAMAPYAIDLDHPCKVLDAQDIDSEKWTEYSIKAKFPMKLMWAREGRTLLRYERAAALACNWTFFVSQPEVDRFAELAPEVAGKLVAIENGVDAQRFSPAGVYETPYTDPAPRMVFTGNMDYWPNADAVIWFVHEVLPKLRARVPGLAFWIVGANPIEEVRALGSMPGISVTGRVEDVRPYVAHASVIVCPLRIARGIQNKVLEGMAMGKPVVVSAPAFEGVRAVAGTELLVADGADEFVERIAEVLDGAHPDLGAAARLAMERGYAWDAVLAKLDGFLAPVPA